MSEHKPSEAKLKARVPRGFIDRTASEIRGVDAMLGKIRAVYERYGFEPVETPLIEYTDALGKFLPDQDRPNEGVFSFQDDDEQWLSLRYDLTAPLARYVAEHFEQLPKPYRSYRAGWVFRNEKPGPGRFRQFMQFDADTVGTASIAADAENAMMFADIMEAVGIRRGDYRVRVNNRKVLDGLMEAAGLAGTDQAGTRLTVLRAIDKLDKFGPEGVRLLLGAGRRDESGDFTKGAGLAPAQISVLESYITTPATADPAALDALRPLFAASAGGQAGLDELASLLAQVGAAGYGADRIVVDPSVVRGLEYYTGPVYEAELTFETVNDAGEPARFGSVGGGGRYDGLVGRFRSDAVPATGISIGVSRLAAALRALGRLEGADAPGPVVVLVMDRNEPAAYQALVGRLRNAGIAAEMYLGESGMKAQMKYADRRRSPCVVIQGSDERARGTVQIKDLVEGARAAEAIKSNQEWRETRPAQFECTVDDMVAKVSEVLERHR